MFSLKSISVRFRSVRFRSVLFCGDLFAGYLFVGCVLLGLTRLFANTSNNITVMPKLGNSVFSPLIGQGSRLELAELNIWSLATRKNV